MGGCSLALTMVFYATEALYFRSSTLNFYVIFPCVLNSEYPVLFNKHHSKMIKNFNKFNKKEPWQSLLNMYIKYIHII